MYVLRNNKLPAICILVELKQINSLITRRLLHVHVVKLVHITRFIDTLHILRLQNGNMYIIDTRTPLLDPDSNSFAQIKTLIKDQTRNWFFTRENGKCCKSCFKVCSVNLLDIKKLLAYTCTRNM